MPSDLISARAVIQMLQRERRKLIANAADAESRGDSATWMHDRAQALYNVVPQVQQMAARARKRPVAPPSKADR